MTGLESELFDSELGMRCGSRELRHRKARATFWQRGRVRDVREEMREVSNGRTAFHRYQKRRVDRPCPIWIRKRLH